MMLLDFCLWYVTCLISHELGHYVITKCFGWKVCNLKVNWYCEGKVTMQIPKKEEFSYKYFLVCIMGPILGFVTTLLCLYFINIPYFMKFFLHCLRF